MNKIIGNFIIGAYKKYFKLTNVGGLFYRIEIETTTVCNRKCSYCPNSTHDRGKHLMDLELFKKIMTELKELKWNGIIYLHHYGEPLLDKRMEELVRIARINCPRSMIALYTNGDFLDEKMYQRLNHFVSYFCVTNHGNLNKNIPKHKNIHVLKIENFNNRSGLVNLGVMKRITKCNYPSDELCVEWNGNVVLCSNDYFAKYCFGNIGKQRIIDIWNKPEFKVCRDDIAKGNFKYFDICKKCKTMKGGVQ